MALLSRSTVFTPWPKRALPPRKPSDAQLSPQQTFWMRQKEMEETATVAGAIIAL